MHWIQIWTYGALLTDIAMLLQLRDRWGDLDWNYRQIVLIGLASSFLLWPLILAWSVGEWMD